MFPECANLIEKRMASQEGIAVQPFGKNALKTILITGLIVGALDGFAAVLLTYGFYDRPPFAVFKYIASGLLGQSAFSGGPLTITFGVACHFFIALMWTFALFFLHPTISTVLRNKATKSIFYGSVIWIVMNLIVLPLSRVPAGSISINQVITGVSILIVAAGVPLAISFDKYFFRK
jgi:hypothetical protein